MGVITGIMNLIPEIRFLVMKTLAEDIIIELQAKTWSDLDMYTEFFKRVPGSTNIEGLANDVAKEPCTTQGAIQAMPIYNLCLAAGLCISGGVTISISRCPTRGNSKICPRASWPNYNRLPGRLITYVRSIVTAAGQFADMYPNLTDINFEALSYIHHRLDGF